MRRITVKSQDGKMGVCMWAGDCEEPHLARGEGRDRELIGKWLCRTLLGVQWLKLHASNAAAVSSIPGQETRIPRAMRGSQKAKINR